MNYQPTIAARPSDLRPVRWSLGDLFGIALVTIALAAAAILLLQLPALFGATALRDLLRDRPLIAAMIAGGLLYTLAVVAIHIVIVRRGRGTWREIGFRAPPPLAVLLTPLIFIGQLIALAVANGIMIALLGEFENPQVAALTDPAGFSWANFAAVFVVGAIVAPIVEETIFRGLLYQWLRKHTGVIGAVLASAAIFSAIHVIPILFPALFAIGVVLALAFEWSKSLWVVIALHFMQNALGIGLIFLIQANPQLVPQP
jgi:membrane protease YdiL (CAAX protease family)